MDPLDFNEELSKEIMGSDTQERNRQSLALQMNYDVIANICPNAKKDQRACLVCGLVKVGQSRMCSTLRQSHCVPADRMMPRELSSLYFLLNLLLFFKFHS